VTKHLDHARDDPGVRLRTARLRRGMTQTALAELACVSPSFMSMVETGQRELIHVCDLVALADVLKVSELYLADGLEDSPLAGQSAGPDSVGPGSPGVLRQELNKPGTEWRRPTASAGGPAGPGHGQTAAHARGPARPRRRDPAGGQRARLSPG
jgi:transcriptional regulator with XRE-family HTH domain